MTDKKILIIDDDMTALDLVDLLFQRSGFEVVRRTDGEAALECVSRECPEVILIDLMMPKMSGQECIKALRDRGVEVPIVAFTALNDTEVHTETIAIGATMVLSKPCKPDTLVRQIEELLAR